jgi:hypothetical protein
VSSIVIALEEVLGKRRTFEKRSSEEGARHQNQSKGEKQ